MEGFVRKGQRNVPTAVLSSIALFVASSSSAAVLSVEDFGAVGDGKQNDSPAVVKAIDALRSGDTLAFSAGKTYRLGRRKDSTFQIDLQGMTNVTVNGNGAMLLNNPWRASIRMVHCDGVTVRNFEIEQDPLGYTQGTITKISPEEAFFDVRIMDGYELLPAGVSRWDWGSIIDPELRRIRRDMSDHFRSERIDPLGGRAYRVTVQKNFAEALVMARIGDIFFQPFTYNGYASNIHITNSKDCLLENMTLYSGRSSMSSRVDLNTGRITLRGFKVLVKPGTDRMVSNWRDGVHCKDNRIGPIIENCVFERMLDDSINLSQNTLMASEVISNTAFRMAKAEGPKHWTQDSSSVWEGDELMVFYPQSGEYVGPFKVIHVDENEPEIITLDRPVKNVVTGGVRSRIDGNATHFYNLNMCNAGFIVRNNTFLPQRRHAVLARCPNGLIENNTIVEVGGHGIEICNSYGHFYEGPFPQNIIIRNNTIRNTHDSPIRVCTQSGSAKTRIVKNIQISGNVITSEEPAIELGNAADVTIEDNRFCLPDGSRMQEPIRQDGCAGVTLGE